MRSSIDEKCAVLIPSCSEPAIADTIRSIGRQIRRPAVTVIVLNNCNDNGLTRSLAQQASELYKLNLVILEMKHNEYMKAGALNYGYKWLTENYSSVEFLIQMDADSILAKDFIENTVHALDRQKNSYVGALSCSFVGKNNLAKNRYQSVLMWLQNLEYVKYHDSAILRNVTVVSGTGCALRIPTLEQVRADRGYVWATDSLVEDYELTLKIRSLGWQTRKSSLFRVYTDLMPSIKSLVKQRERWQRGTNDELRRYGITRVTAIDHIKQWIHGLSLVLNLLVIIYIAFIIAAGTFTPSWLAAGLLLMIMFRQGYHARSLGWKQAAFTASLIPDLTYGLLRNYWWLKALVSSMVNTKKIWT